METRTPIQKTGNKLTPKRTYKTLDEAVQTKAERMEKLLLMPTGQPSNARRNTR